DNEIFWIIRHGLKYTGMPGWPSQARPDEVWDMVAFVRLLPSISAAEYGALIANGPIAPPLTPPAPTEITALRPPADAVATCIGCHGADGAGHPTGAYPRLDGLGADYIAEQLRAFATGRRQSGVMLSAVAALSSEERDLVAAYYGAITALPISGG